MINEVDKKQCHLCYHSFSYSTDYLLHRMSNWTLYWIYRDGQWNENKPSQIK